MDNFFIVVAGLLFASIGAILLVMYVQHKQKLAAQGLATVEGGTPAVSNAGRVFKKRFSKTDYDKSVGIMLRFPGSGYLHQTRFLQELIKQGKVKLEKYSDQQSEYENEQVYLLMQGDQEVGLLAVEYGKASENAFKNASTGDVMWTRATVRIPSDLCNDTCQTDVLDALRAAFPAGELFQTELPSTKQRIFTCMMSPHGWQIVPFAMEVHSASSTQMDLSYNIKQFKAKGVSYSKPGMAKVGEWAQWAFSQTKNIVIFGPTGTGKSVLGSQFLASCPDAYVIVLSPKILSILDSTTGPSLAQAIERARAKRPLIFHIDEAQVIYKDPILKATLLSLMDGALGDQFGASCLVMANDVDRTELKDALRAGRADVFVELDYLEDATPLHEYIRKAFPTLQFTGTVPKGKFGLGAVFGGFTSVDEKAPDMKGVKVVKEEEVEDEPEEV